MKIRDATAADLWALDPLKRAFESEIPEPSWVEFDIDQELVRFADVLAREIAVVAEDDDGAVVGFALARRLSRRLGLITDLYVVPSAVATGSPRSSSNASSTGFASSGWTWFGSKSWPRTSRTVHLLAVGVRRGGACVGGLPRGARAKACRERLTARRFSVIASSHLPGLRQPCPGGVASGTWLR